MIARGKAAGLAAALGAAILLAVLVFARAHAGAGPCFAGDATAESPPAADGLVHGAAVARGSSEVTLDLVRGAPVAPNHRVVVGTGTLVPVTGWAADFAAKRIVRAVLVRIDDEAPLRADSCGVRVDVARAFANPAYAPSGFTARLRARGGAHRIAFDALSADGRTLYRDVRRIELVGVAAGAVAAAAVQGDLTSIGGVGVSNDERAGLAHVHRAGNDLTLTGWLIDRSGGTPAPVRAVDVLIDGRVAGRAAYGGPRPDVAVFVQAPLVANAGFSARIFTDDMRRGRHVLEFRGTLFDGRTAVLPARFVLDVTR